MWFKQLLHNPRLVLTLLILLALAGNIFNISFFFGVDFLFGSIVVFIILVQYGFYWGITASIIASSYTYILWSHPYAIIIFSLETAWVGLWLNWHERHHLVWYDLLFWLLLGIGLVWLFYYTILGLPSLDTWLIALKQAFNGIFNVIVANLFITYARIHPQATDSSKNIRLNLQEAIQNILIITILLAVLTIMVINSRFFMHSLEKDITQALKHRHEEISHFIEIWFEHNQALFQLFFRKFSRIESEEIKRALLKDTYNIGGNFNGITVYNDENQELFRYPAYFNINSNKNHQVLITDTAQVESIHLSVGINLQRLQQKIRHELETENIFNLLIKNDNVILINHDTSDNILAQHLQQLVNYDKSDFWTPSNFSNQAAMKRWRNSFYIHRTELLQPEGWQMLSAIQITDYQNKLYHFYVYNMAISISTILIILVLSYTISFYLAKSLKDLSKITEMIAKDYTFSQIAKYPDSRLHEVKVLTEHFSTMANTLNQHLRKLQKLNQTLNQKIYERKQIEHELRETNEKLSIALASLTTTQQELLHTEKMAVVGQLVAGVAHEINTPLATINLSIHQVNDFLTNSVSELIFLINTLPEVDKLLFYQLVQDAINHSVSELSSREYRQQRRELIKKLATYATEDAQAIADILVDINMYENFEQYLQLLEKNNYKKVLLMVQQLTNFKRNTRAILLASERAAKIVFALKSYARQQQQTEKISADIVEGVETVLTLYHNQLKQGVEVVRNYAMQSAVIDCYPDELNQVWMNLIQNALQAMNYHGILQISVTRQANTLCISITDNGNGIPEQIQSKIFEPFFTTKAVGEGTGLGLDIVKKIIDKHQGEITLVSQPGHTCFTIALPYIV